MALFSSESRYLSSEVGINSLSTDILTYLALFEEMVQSLMGIYFNTAALRFQVLVALLHKMSLKHTFEGTITTRTLAELKHGNR